jgi:hypothetical protein
MSTAPSMPVSKWVWQANLWMPTLKYVHASCDPRRHWMLQRCGATAAILVMLETMPRTKKSGPTHRQEPSSLLPRFYRPLREVGAL